MFSNMVEKICFLVLCELTSNMTLKGFHDVPLLYIQNFPYLSYDAFRGKYIFIKFSNSNILTYQVFQQPPPDVFDRQEHGK